MSQLVSPCQGVELLDSIRVDLDLVQPHVDGFESVVAARGIDHGQHMILAQLVSGHVDGGQRASLLLQYGTKQVA